MAFMVEGHFPGFGPYGKALDRAKDYLLKRSEDSPSGAMGVKMYEIGLFTIAMSELWGMTSDPEDNKEIQVALERIVEVILRSQSPLGGWRYAPRPDAGQDTSVTAMVFVSLASAREAGVLVPAETIERLTGYLRDQAFDEQRGGFGYQGKGYTIACTAGGFMRPNLRGTGTRNGSRQQSTRWRMIPRCFPEKTTATSTTRTITRCRRWSRRAKSTTPSGIPRSVTLSSLCSSPTGRGRKRNSIIRTRRRCRLSSSEPRTGIFRSINVKEEVRCSDRRSKKINLHACCTLASPWP